MVDLRKIAKQHIDNDMWVIPVSSNKQPAISNWRDLQTRPMTDSEIERSFKRCYGIALLMGGPMRLFACDFDLKYSLNPNLYEEIKEKVPNDILKKMQVNSTKNKGFHWTVQVPESRLFGNEKFANRYTTAFEQRQIYDEYYSDPRTRDIALKTAFNHKSLVLIESRSGSPEKAGGYVLVPPTFGYDHVYGKIQEINEEEYDVLVEVLRSFNEVKELGKINKKYDNFEWQLSPWDDYNERGDVVSLLESSGWTIIDEGTKNIRFKRPGATSGSSALFDKDTRIFNCFSTSTCFDVTKSYTPVSVFVELECDGDTKQAYQDLINNDYGIK